MVTGGTQAGCGRWGSYSQGMPTAGPCRPQAPNGMCKSATSCQCIWPCRPRQRMLPRLRKDRNKPRVHPRGRRTNKKKKINNNNNKIGTSFSSVPASARKAALANKLRATTSIPAFKEKSKIKGRWRGDDLKKKKRLYKNNIAAPRRTPNHSPP